MFSRAKNIWMWKTSLISMYAYRWIRKSIKSTKTHFSFNLKPTWENINPPHKLNIFLSNVPNSKLCVKMSAMKRISFLIFPLSCNTPFDIIALSSSVSIERKLEKIYFESTLAEFTQTILFRSHHHVTIRDRVTIDLVHKKLNFIYIYDVQTRIATHVIEIRDLCLFNSVYLAVMCLPRISMKPLIKWWHFLSFKMFFELKYKSIH